MLPGKLMLRSPKLTLGEQDLDSRNQVYQGRKSGHRLIERVGYGAYKIKFVLG